MKTTPSKNNPNNKDGLKNEENLKNKKVSSTHYFLFSFSSFSFSQLSTFLIEGMLGSKKRERNRQTERLTDRKPETERQSRTQRDRDGKRETHIERQKDRHRHRETET